jgi:hypothetical protein
MRRRRDEKEEEEKEEEKEKEEEGLHELFLTNQKPSSKYQGIKIQLKDSSSRKRPRVPRK